MENEHQQQKEAGSAQRQVSTKRGVPEPASSPTKRVTRLQC